MLGTMIGEWAGIGLDVGEGSAGGPPLPLTGCACAMGGVVVALTQRYRIAGTLRVWGRHHPEMEDVPGLSALCRTEQWFERGDEDGSPHFRPWASPAAWLSVDPEAVARDVLSLVHEEDGVLYQAGMAAVRVAHAAMRGAPPDHCRMIPGEYESLRHSGDPTIEALLTGIDLGLSGDLAHVARLLPAWSGPEEIRGAVGAVAGMVSTARHGLPGWAHAVALRLDDSDVMSAMGLLDARHSATPVRRDLASTPSPPAIVTPSVPVAPRARLFLAALRRALPLARGRGIIVEGEVS